MHRGEALGIAYDRGDEIRSNGRIADRNRE
jgi:hypothetical protein